jgi:hypothetical protein
LTKDITRGILEIMIEDNTNAPENRVAPPENPELVKKLFGPPESFPDPNNPPKTLEEASIQEETAWGLVMDQLSKDRYNTKKYFFAEWGGKVDPFRGTSDSRQFVLTEPIKSGDKEGHVVILKKGAWFLHWKSEEGRLDMERKIKKRLNENLEDNESFQEDLFLSFYAIPPGSDLAGGERASLDLIREAIEKSKESAPTPEYYRKAVEESKESVALAREVIDFLNPSDTQ